MNYEESSIQIAMLKWFRLQYPNLEGLLVGYPGGINLDVRTASRMKAMGLRAGFPDLMLLVPRKIEDRCHATILCGTATRYDHYPKFSHALFIELKTTRGRLSKIQQDFHENLRSQNYTVIVCRGFEEAQECISSYLNNYLN
jgi:hypothetical protein